MNKDQTKLYISDDVYSIPVSNKYIIYAPLKGIAFIVNKDTVELLARIKQGKSIGKKSPEVQKALNLFQESDILHTTPESPKAVPNKTTFSPLTVTLFTTYDCNLRCIYCYSRGGEDIDYMPLNIAKASIDLILKNAIENNEDKIHITFHGGGEPTLNWKVMVESMIYAKAMTKKHGKEVRASLTSNCILTEKEINWISKNIEYVNVSLDGTKEVQNKQRPSLIGDDSFDRVMSTLRHFEKLKTPYGIRTTITNDSIKTLKEFVKFICENLNAESIHIEPLFECGRCSTSGAMPPAPEIFIKEFFISLNEAAKYGTRFTYSGTRLNKISSTFCGASGSNFVVLPDGNVTSCYEVCRTSDQRANSFFFGKFDNESGTFKFDNNKLKTLSKRIVQNMEECKDCFIKWHCSGECMGKAADIKGDILDIMKERCYINQAIAKRELYSIIMNDNKEHRQNIRSELIEF